MTRGRPVWRTRRLRLRPLTRADQALFVDLYTDAETMRFIARPLSRVDAAASFRATLQALASADGPRFLTVVDAAARRKVGVCAIQPVEPRARRVEIGIMLKREARRQSYGTELIAALVGLAFETLPIDAVWVQYNPANVAARRLFSGLGFVAHAGTRPRKARRTQSIRIMQRSAWRVATTMTKGASPCRTS